MANRHGGASAATPVERGWSGRRTLWSEAMGRLLANRLALTGLIVIGLLVFIAVFAPLIARQDPTFQDYYALQQSPNVKHWLGTDDLGRDAFSRLVYGARVSLVVGIFTQIVALSIGLPIGAVAGLFGKWVDNLLMRATDIVYAFPDLLLIILLRAIFGGSLWMIFLAIGLVAWGNIARLTRGQFLSLREQDFVVSARALGASRWRIGLRHLLPNSLGPLIVTVTFAVPRAIFAEAALSYIGIGVRPPTPTWGAMIRDGYDLIFSSTYLVALPAFAIALTMLAFTFVGDGLRDALDPQTRYGGKRRATQ